MADSETGNAAFDAWLAKLNEGYGFERLEYGEMDVQAAFEAGAATAGNDLLALSDSAMRMELVLRLIRLYAMGEIVRPESGAVRDWLRDWIDGNHHGPVGGPLLWPAAIGSAVAQLRAWGFERSEGNPAYVVLRRAPVGGEAMQ